MILTTVRRGVAARSLATLCASDHVEVVAVVFPAGVTAPRSRRLRRRLAKVRQVGVLGALNGLRLRRWFRDPLAPDVVEEARRLAVPVIETASVNGRQTRAALRRLDCDLGLVLGSSYVHERVFSLPKHGMVNVHAEVLPQFRGAQGVIWPVHEGVAETGFTVHQVDSGLDTGPILYRQVRPIRFAANLRTTVEQNLADTRAAIPAALRHVCEHYAELAAAATPQGAGASFTTPTLRQFLRMVRQHRRLRSGIAASPIRES